MSKAGQTVSVDITKLGMGMKTIFSGCAMLFESLGVQGEALQQLNGLTDTAMKEEQAGSSSKQTKQAAVDTPAKELPLKEDALPWNTEAAASAEKAPNEPPAVSITSDDLLKVASQKITTNRKNSPKIKALLTSYGCAAISDIPDDKREAFLNDLAQL
jgi:hypothetical protein